MVVDDPYDFDGGDPIEIETAVREQGKRIVIGPKHQTPVAFQVHGIMPFKIACKLVAAFGWSYRYIRQRSCRLEHRQPPLDCLAPITEYALKRPSTLHLASELPTGEGYLHPAPVP